MSGENQVISGDYSKWLLGVTTQEDPQKLPTSVERLYILDCGLGGSEAMSRFTPGKNRGKRVTTSVECYLIKAKQGWFLWGTGISDYVASLPNGWQAGPTETGVHWTKDKKVMSQLNDLGVKPSDLLGIGISHTHPDHIGNIELFPDTPVFMSRDEYNYYFTPGHPTEHAPGDPVPSFSANHPVHLIDEDWDVFDDNSLIMFGTPGHTPGHTSLMLHLPKTGWVICTDDAVHMRQNFFNDVVPYYRGMPQAKRLETLLSMQRIRDLVNYYHAKLIIQHDLPQSKTLKYAPEYYE